MRHRRPHWCVGSAACTVDAVVPVCSSMYAAAAASGSCIVTQSTYPVGLHFRATNHIPACRQSLALDALRLSAQLAYEVLAVTRDAAPAPLAEAAQLLHTHALLVRGPGAAATA
jgi:hypothetical protein